MNINQLKMIAGNDEILNQTIAFITNKGLMQELETHLNETITVGISSLNDNAIFYQAIKEYKLPPYMKPIFQQFVVACCKQKLPLQNYRGRNFYDGPATYTDNLNQTIQNLTPIPVISDNLGKGWVVYPGPNDK